ncbi:uncharacterized protein LOC114435593 isoform X2 [Parambassis ranga]|uniref:Uncharacterized protein LOC114435593 isoform X2 n=1 Tax=Parambassis ranga TaxID=210632 RepID=A0A6P7IE66_9TELE|nr:uncharacterized protein LOC114435593 isoform X2 [Parambassis ranga]
MFCRCLTSWCQPAPLTCENLLIPAERGPDIAGRWYVVAVSSQKCTLMPFWATFLTPSAQVDMSSTDKPNNYKADVYIKSYGRCKNSSAPVLYENSTIYDAENTVAESAKLELLQTGSQDCVVLKEGDFLSSALLLCRRMTVTAAEMTEFQTQSSCLTYDKVSVLNTDHELSNCKSMEDEDFDDETSEKVVAALRNTFSGFFQCVTDTVLYYPYTAYEWARNKWASLW